MQPTVYPVSIQPLLFTHEELSSCFFYAPTDEELEFQQMWKNLASAMPASVRREERRGHAGRPGYCLPRDA